MASGLDENSLRTWQRTGVCDYLMNCWVGTVALNAAERIIMLSADVCITGV